MDKTASLHHLISDRGGYYFLSHPRRFGKSPTLSALNAIFSGKKELFIGLWIEQHYDWDKTHPVIHTLQDLTPFDPFSFIF